jgi:hypothetical protein
MSERKFRDGELVKVISNHRAANEESKKLVKWVGHAGFITSYTPSTDIYYLEFPLEEMAEGEMRPQFYSDELEKINLE